MTATAHRSTAVLRLGMVLLLLGACTPATASTTQSAPAGQVDASSRPETPPRELECERDGYPCDNTGVAAPVRERTVALADEAATRLAKASPADVGNWLAGEDGVANVWTGSRGVRFRLDGGRPAWAWMDPADELSASAAIDLSRIDLPSNPGITSASLASSTRGRDAERGTSVEPEVVIPPGIAPRVVGTDPDSKLGLFIAPYAYRWPTSTAAELADIFSQTRGYEGGVRYLANTSPGGTTVSVDTFKQLAGYGVVYLQTQGGRACNAAGDCHPVVMATDIASPDDLGNEIGVELITWRQTGTATGTYGVGLTEDFFFNNYRDPLENAVIYFDVPDIEDENLWAALTAPTSEWYYWNGNVTVAEARPIALAFLGTLAETGRTTSDVYHGMVTQFTVGSSKLVGVKPAAGGATRVREIVYLLDPESGEPLTPDSHVQVLGNLGDGEPDRVAWSVGIDGIGEPDLLATTVNVSIDGILADPFLPGDGTKLNDDTYRLEGELQLTRDLEEGDTVEFLAVAQLADLGLSQQKVTLSVAADEVGTVWEGVVTATSHGPNMVLPTFHATATFTRVPSSNPDPKVVRFSLTSGSFTWSIHGSTEHCDITGGPVSVPLPEDEYSEIIFDVSGASGRGITYSADASLESGPAVDVSQSCDNGDEPYATRAEGTFWLAPMKKGFDLNGDTIAGTYTTGGQVSTTFEWSFHRVK